MNENLPPLENIVVNNEAPDDPKQTRTMTEERKPVNFLTETSQ